MVVVVVVDVVGCQQVVVQIFLTASAVAHRRSDALAVTIVEGVVLVVVVMIPVACPVTSRMVPVVIRSEVAVVMVPGVEMMVVERVVVAPAPTIIEAPVVITVVVRTNIVARPPPVVA